ncbi:MAG: enoyl-CoA hydratase-related protein [Desulfobacterales bacterium]|jgi:enoyl-CoA hydratase/carnithine racemase|nr:enoyl-CoA hydratase-related protein [Desulfobacterales bacterium]
MNDSHLVYQVKDNVAYFTINREPHRNAISIAALKLFHAYLDHAQTDADVRAICITGAGERAFCSGADLGGGMGSDPSVAMAAFKNYARLLKRLSGFPKPTVARVNGACIAGGTGFMLACDIVIASSKATFGTPEVNVGLFPMMIGALIFRNVLRKKAMEMVLLGEKLSARQALEMGMVTRVVEPEDLDIEVEKVLSALVTKSPIGMKIGKEAFYASADMTFEQALDLLAEKLGEVVSTQDAVEGITAFIEKRTPVFKGK